MDDKLWKRLRVFALKQGMSTSEAIRRAVEYAWFDSSARPLQTDQQDGETVQEEVTA